METRSKSRRARIDRFSSLPDDVAHKVLSFLEMEDIFRLSVVSKRCRQLCISTPSLSFDVIPYRTDERKRAQLMNYLERLLFLRKGMDTQDCHIQWCLESSFNFAEEEYRVLSWLHNAVMYNFKQLVLDVNLKRGSDFVLPSCLFRCKSLESLTMRFTNRTGILKIPSSIGGTSGLSSLKYLKMTSVRIEERFGEWISSYCKSLEELSLTEIRGIKSISITSSSLKVLRIYLPYDLSHLHISAERLSFMSLAWPFDSPADNRELQLSAPKLEVFAYLVEHLTEPKPSFDKNLFHVLHAVAANIRGLGLSDDSIMGLHRLGFLPTLFTNLQVLQIWITGSSDDPLPILISFLERTPILHTLFIRKRVFYTNINRVEDDRALGRREPQDVLFLQNLKDVTIELVSQGKNELELIKFFLKTAKDLQNMTVLYASPLRSKVRKAIIQYKKASSNTKLKFLQL